MMMMRFTMTGRMSDCVQLTYRTPAQSVRGLVPDGLELVTRGPWAFWNVMACRVEKVRPAGVPAFCGLSYHHIAYRLRVQAMTERAEVVRGFYFLRSDVDARAVTLLGNRLADLRMQPASVAADADDCGVRYAVNQTPYAAGDLELDLVNTPARLMPGSCFPTTEDARQFCKYQPDALAITERGGERLLRVTHVDRPERAWSETPLRVRSARLGYFESIGQQEHVALEWACRLSAMDCRWRTGQATRLLMQPTPAVKTTAPHPSATPATARAAS